MTLRWAASFAALAVAAGAAIGLVSMPTSSPSPIGSPAQSARALGAPFLSGSLKLRAMSGDAVDLRAPVGGATVVVFYSTECPIASAMLPGVAEIHSRTSRRSLAMAGVCVDPDATDEEVARHAREFGLEMPIVRDRTGELTRRFGVTVAPEAFVLVGAGRLAYRGRIDDQFATRGQRRSSAPSPDLRDAIRAVLDGREPLVARLEPVGCPVPERPGGSPSREGPTFAADVAPILERSCQSCHRPGQSAPFPLLTHAQAAKRATDLADVVEEGLMPPWKPTSGVGPPLRHDRSLLPSEIETLRAWAEAGAPEGSAEGSLEPAAPEPVDGWTLGAPDLILEMPEEFAIPATGDDVYRCFVLPTNLPEDRMITAVEVRPGNPRVVHHTFNYIDIRGLGRQRDAEDPEPGYMCFSGFTGDQIFGAMGGWTPGNEPHFFEDGVGLNLPKGADVVMQVHYHPTGKPERDRTRLGLHFARKPIRRSLQWVSASANPDAFSLPAGEAEARVTASLTIPMDVELHAMTPHMHLLGRRFSATFTTPDGQTEPLIEIDDWDFNRQDTYYLREPLLLPAGTRVFIEGEFDNSEANPRNPSRPPRQAQWGEGTTDEMLILFLALTDAAQDLTQPGARDNFMEEFFQRAGAAIPPPKTRPFR